MEAKKRTISYVLICIGLLSVIWGGYFFAMQGIDKMVKIGKDDFSWVYQVDSVETEGGEVVLHGFAFKLGIDSTEGGFEIVLHDTESGKNYFPKMEYIERKEVNDYFLCEYDYSLSGFRAVFHEEKILLKEKNYKVLLREKGQQMAYLTEIYLHKGELVYVNPTEYKPLDTIGTDLEKIVEQGKVRVYRPDCGMYVYQYNGALYWIADDNHEFVDGDIYVQVHLETTQKNKLPIERLNNNFDWDNRGFYFRDNELSDWNTGKYRVCRFEVPTEYAITHIWTGRRVDEDWIWRSDFRYWYEFEYRNGESA